MSVSPNHDVLLKTPSRKRTREYDMDTHDANEVKRRRSSLPYDLLPRDESPSTVKDITTQTDLRDRFISTLTTTEPGYLLNLLSPRTTRVAASFGMVQPRLLSFHDHNPNHPPSLLSHLLSDRTLPMRAYYSHGIQAQTYTPNLTYSAAKHGRSKPERVLDSGLMEDFPLHPCAWSSKNLIAAVIRGRVYTHNVSTNGVTCIADYRHAQCVEWTSDNELLIGHNFGGVSMIDLESAMRVIYFVPVFPDGDVSPYTDDGFTNAMSWNKELNVLAVGCTSGAVSYYDARQAKAIKNIPGKSSHAVQNVQWSLDGLFLASGHEKGIVKCMDWRAGQTFELKAPHKKTAHRGSVKSLAWAPWKPRLLATGGDESDHTVRIWSLSDSDSNATSARHANHSLSLSFSSGITSLHFSPHTTELLSTHGEAAVDPAAYLNSSQGRRRPTRSLEQKAMISPSNLPTQHSILVHSYPSRQRVFAVLDAHAEPIIDSALSPDGTRILTFSEDETLRIWSIWGKRTEEKTHSILNQRMIR